MSKMPPSPPPDAHRASRTPAASALVRAHLARVVSRVRSERTTWSGAAFGAVTVLLLISASSTGANHTLIWLLLGGLWLAHRLANSRIARWEPAPATIARKLETFDPSLQGRLQTALDQDSLPTTPFLQLRLWDEVAARAEVGSWETYIPKWRLLTASFIKAVVQVAVIHFGILWIFSPQLSQHADVTKTPAKTPSLAPEVTPGNIDLEKGSHFAASARLPQTTPGVSLVIRYSDSESEKIPMQQALAEPLYGASVESVERDLEYWIETPSSTSPVFKIRTFEHPKLDKSNATVRYPEGTQPSERLYENARKLTVPEGSAIDWELQLNKPVKTARLTHKSGLIEPLQTKAADKTLHWVIKSASASIEASLELEDYDGRPAKERVAFQVQVQPNQPPRIRPILPKPDARFTSIEEIDFEAEASDETSLKRWGLTIAIGTQAAKEIVLGHDAKASQKQHLQHLEALEPHHLTAGDSLSWFFWAEDATSNQKIRRIESDLFLSRIRPFEEIYRQGLDDDGEGSEGDPQLLELQKQVIAATWNLRKKSDPVDGNAAHLKKSLETIRDSEKKVHDMAAEAAAKDSNAKRLVYYAAAQEHLAKAVTELSTAAATNAAPALDGAITEERAAYDALTHLSPSNYEMKRSKSKSSQNQERTAQMNDLEFAKEEDRYEKKTQAKTSEQEKDRTDAEELLARLRALARKQDEVSERIRELQAKVQSSTDPKEQEAAKRELKRLSDEQKSLAQELEDAQQKTASKADSPAEQQEQMAAAREAAQRAANALEKGALDEARAAAAKSSDKVRETTNSLRKQLSGQNKTDARELQDQAQELAKKERQISEAMNPSAKKEGSQLQAGSTQKQLADDLYSQRQNLKQLQNNLQRVAENTEAAESTFSKTLQDIHRSSIQNQTEGKLKVASDALTMNRPDVSRRAEQAAAQDLEKLAGELQKAAEELFGDDAQSLRKAKSALDELGRQIVSNSQPAAKGSEAKGHDGTQAQQSGPKTESKTGSQPGSQTNPQAGSQTDLKAGTQSGSVRGGADGTPEQSIGNWLSTLDRVEALVEKPALRTAVARAQQAGEQLRSEMKRAATKPSPKEIEERLLSPLAQIRDAISAELARLDGKQSETPVDSDPVPRKFEGPVRKYYEALGGGR